MLMVISSIIAAWSDISQTLATYSIWLPEVGVEPDARMNSIVLINSGYVWMLANCLAQAAYVCSSQSELQGKTDVSRTGSRYAQAYQKHWIQRLGYHVL